MKRVITVIVIIILVVLGFSIWGGDKSPVVDNTDNGDGGLTRDDFRPVDSDSTDASLLGKLKNASVAVAESDSKVALSNGKAQFTSDGVKGSVALGDIAVDATVGGTKYIVSTVAVKSGTEATYHYAVLFEEKEGAITDLSYALLGDRVNVIGLRADDVQGGLVVSVSYLEHDRGEPKTAAPTVPRTKILIVENNMFNAAKEITL